MARLCHSRRRAVKRAGLRRRAERGERRWRAGIAKAGTSGIVEFKDLVAPGAVLTIGGCGLGAYTIIIRGRLSL